MRLVYIGPFDAVNVPLPYGGELTVKRGEETNLPDSLAVVLLEQVGNWEKGGVKL